MMIMFGMVFIVTFVCMVFYLDADGGMMCSIFS